MACPNGRQAAAKIGSRFIPVEIRGPLGKFLLTEFTQYNGRSVYPSGSPFPPSIHPANWVSPPSPNMKGIEGCGT